MTIRFRCRCGEPLRADDDEAGERIRCRVCDKLNTVPDGEDDDGEPRRRSRGGRSSHSSGAGLYLAIGGGLFLMCVIAGLVFAFARPSRSAAEESLLGEWEPDPQAAGGNLGFNNKLSFRADHSYQITLFVEINGRWEVVTRDGNRLTVRLVHQVMGLDQDNPPTATITVIDPDHLEFTANEKPVQLNGRFRRVGTGPPAPRLPPPMRPNPFPNGPPVDPNRGLPIDPNAPVAPIPQGGLDVGVVPDCEVHWGGAWFKAKVMKVENDRWFIHYVGWANTWDEWVGKDRIRFLK